MKLPAHENGRSVLLASGELAVGCQRIVVRGGFGTAEPMVSATFRDSRRARSPSAGGRLVTASFMPTVLEIFVIRRAGGRPGGCAWGEHCRRSRSAGLPGNARGPPGGHRGCTPGSAVHLKPGKMRSARPSVAVRETADGVHRPPQLCTPRAAASLIAQ